MCIYIYIYIYIYRNIKQKTNKQINKATIQSLRPYMWLHDQRRGSETYHEPKATPMAFWHIIKISNNKLHLYKLPSKSVSFLKKKKLQLAYKFIQDRQSYTTLSVKHMKYYSPLLRWKIILHNIPTKLSSKPFLHIT